MNGAEPAENTYRSLVDWASKIETRQKRNKTRPIAATQWLTEGNAASKPETKSYPRCHLCRRSNHTARRCSIHNQSAMSKNDAQVCEQLKQRLEQTLTKHGDQNDIVNQINTEIQSILSKFLNKP